MLAAPALVLGPVSEPVCTRSCLGMHLFGGKFCVRTDGTTLCSCADLFNPAVKCFCDRKHFNTFLWATVTVFQVSSVGPQPTA